MAKDDPHFRLRIPAELKAEIEKSASANNRSINAEIVSRLELSKAYPPLIEDVFKEFEKQLDEMRDSNRYLRGMLEQIRLLGGILEHIASTDGNLDPEFMKLLRNIVASKGKDTSWLPDE